MGTSLAFRAGILVFAGVAAASAQTYHATIIPKTDRLFLPRRKSFPRFLTGWCKSA